jgi:uncharacterized MAPEG superfamily protein
MATDILRSRAATFLAIVRRAFEIFLVLVMLYCCVDVLNQTLCQAAFGYVILRIRFSIMDAEI